MEKDTLAEIYVYLPDEETSRAVQARHLHGNLYQIVSEQLADERWEFTTGDLVRCKRYRFDDGKVEMLAYRKIEADT
ncbi:MAG TPA: hypothetical protein VGO69_02560 [Pyrinomonadaceae bacterium]|nr:hypothetical protein [Pyrinomonadaceae bacterium]